MYLDMNGEFKSIEDVRNYVRLYHENIRSQALSANIAALALLDAFHLMERVIGNPLIPEHYKDFSTKLTIEKIHQFEVSINAKTEKQ